MVQVNTEALVAIDSFARNIENIYEMFLGGLKGTVVDIVSKDKLMTSEGWLDAQIEIYSLDSLVYRQTNTGPPMQAIASQVDKSFTDNVSSEYEEVVTTAEISELIIALLNMSSGDIKSAIANLKEYRYRIAALSAFKNVTSASKQAKFEFLTSSKEFRIKDRSGKQWQSQILAKTAARQAALSVYNNLAVIALAKRGQELGVLANKDENHPSHGLVFSIADTDSMYPSYDDVRGKYLHPNANALVSNEQSP